MRIIDMNFISQNIAPKNAKQIIIFDQNNEQIAMLPLGNLSSKSIGDKLYSFGALSDIHLPYSSVQASGDFQKALNYYNNVEPVNFICISGDMSDTGTEAEWVDFKNHVDLYSPDTSVYIATGNHDASQGLTYEYPIAYTGHPLYYSFTRGDDVFIMFGMSSWDSTPFTDESLQWLYDTLEANIDKRCFVFQHMMRLDGCGNAHGLYPWDGLDNKNGKVFISLMEHYKNVIWFHGHSHTPFKLQTVQPTPIANYDRLFGCHSVHIPSLASPRYGNSDTIADAEGYIVDVYENGIHLRGIDFIESEFLAIASYWVDTTPSKVEPGTYFDSSGTIMIPGPTLPDGSELFMNQRYSYSGGGLTTDSTTPSMFAVIFPVEHNTNYKLKIENSSIPLTSASGSSIYELNDSKGPNRYINGGNIPTMSEGIVFSEDARSAEISFSITDSSYVALSLRVVTTGTATLTDIENYIITLEEDVAVNAFPEGTEIKDNIQYSESGGGYRDMSGYKSITIPVLPNKTYRLTITGTSDGMLVSNQATLYELTPEQGFSSRINSSKYIYDMDNTTISEDYTSVEVIFTTTADAGYIVFSGVISDSKLLEMSMVLNETLKQGNITDDITWHENMRLSSSDGSYKEHANAMSSGDIEVEPGDVITVYGITTISSGNLYINGYKDGTFVVNIPLSNAGWNPKDDANMYVEMDSINILTIQIKEDTNINSIKFSFMVDTQQQPLQVFRNEITNRKEPIVIPEGSELYINQRYSQSGGGLTNGTGYFALIIPINDQTTYKLSFDNMPTPNLNSTSTTLYMLDSNKANAVNFNGSNFICQMTEGVTLSEDYKSGVVDIPAVSGRVYLAFTFPIAGTTITEDNLKGIVITLEACTPITIPSGSELFMNQRYSQSGGGLTDSLGYISLIIPIDDQTNYTLSMNNLHNLSLSTTNTTLYMLDSDKANASVFNGSNAIISMTEGVSISDNRKFATVEIPAVTGKKYLALTISVIAGSTTTEDDLNGLVITLETNQ